MKKLYMFLTAVLMIFMMITGCGSSGSSSNPTQPSSAKAITAFTFPISTNTTITEAAHTIAITVPDVTNVTELVPAITISTGAIISPASGVAHDFTSPVTYTVTAADTTTQAYVVTVISNYISTNIGKLKYVPSGSFQRDGTPSNISTITTAFRMSEKEITRDQFSAVTGVDPVSAYSSGTDDPVQNVTWYDAVEFCNLLSVKEELTPVYAIVDRDPASGYPITSATVTPAWANNGYRLPTEMEWEWAAIGATTGTTAYLKAFAGDTGSNSIGDYAVFGYYDDPKSDGQTTTERTNYVGSKLPNELGLYDMSGNVYEWCWDLYREYPDGALNNNTYRDVTSGDVRVFRGGSWDANASHAAVAARSSDYPDAHSYSLGFRVVRP